jgi:hypothetical protein
MLKSLKLHHVGPVPGLEAVFADRLNVLTGDNGLGKSFLLDVCFWALTGTWPADRMALPTPNDRSDLPKISYHIQGVTSEKKQSKSASFDFSTQTWHRPKGRPFKPGLVIYASVDGSFSVWDPARNYWRDEKTGLNNEGISTRAYQFTPETLAKGLPDGQCEGLERDWVTWYQTRGNGASHPSPFEFLQAAIQVLSHPLDPLRIGEPRRIWLNPPRPFPVLKANYGDVPYPHWSAGLRRIMSFAYLLVWAWTEHLEAAKLRNEPPEDRLVLLIDEIEAHLHPRWQRTILPAILKVVEVFHSNLDIQLFVATHSPLILASLETHFDSATDALFRFDTADQQIRFDQVPWANQGDVVAWLTSPIFGLDQARSREAELAIEAAEALMRGDTQLLPTGLKTRAEIHSELLRTIPGLDPFWPRWIVEVPR